jgi:hypothetical protein
LIAVTALLALTGCATTRITSQVDATALSATYDTALVHADFSDLDLRKLGESELRRTLALRGVEGVAATDIFFPGEAVGEEEIRARLDDRGIQAVIVIGAYDAGTSERYRSPTFYTRGTAWVSGNQVQTRSTTQSVGGGVEKSLWAKFWAELVDLKSERRVWLATAKSSSLSGETATEHTLLRSFSGKVASQLVTDGVIPAFRSPKN